MERTSTVVGSNTNEVCLEFSPRKESDFLWLIRLESPSRSIEDLLLAMNIFIALPFSNEDLVTWMEAGVDPTVVIPDSDERRDREGVLSFDRS
jgi:hypothetical protein